MTRETEEQNKKALAYHEFISKKMHGLCSEFFQTFGFNHLCYNRFQTGNKFGMFMTDHSFTERSLTQKIDRLSFADKPIRDHMICEKNTTRNMIWDMSQNHPMYDWLLENNRAHGVSFYMRGDGDEIEAWHLATDKNNPQMNQLYTYHMDFLTHFIAHLSTQCTEMRQADSSLLFQYHDNKSCGVSLSQDLPYAKEVNTFKNSHFFAKYPFQVGSETIFLTSKEYFHLKNYISGYSSKEIARELSVSHRTVETSLYRIKMKLQCISKLDLKNVYKKSIYALGSVQK